MSNSSSNLSVSIGFIICKLLRLTLSDTKLVSLPTLSIFYNALKLISSFCKDVSSSSSVKSFKRLLDKSRDVRSLAVARPFVLLILQLLIPNCFNFFGTLSKFRFYDPLTTKDYKSSSSENSMLNKFVSFWITNDLSFT
ncbi:Hypothetical_protein [Hexamita inflata]|uniref:Hypothetical_protein n=1 Tax=Hexamita inflata TaxID=28002 RepID=A0AA86RU39_9EUKA|nr:Hypothetical protein HINF_LOCUS15344 [Hexamita inflata]CAI9972575.1 Hypothetical protein HINF_LOCUS60220 [Hexamita inflata]